MKISTFRLVPGVQRIPLTPNLEKYITDDQDADRRLASPYSHHALKLDELDNGDVLLKRPDGVTVRVFQHAIESKGL